MKRESEKRTGQSTLGLPPYLLGDVSTCFQSDPNEGKAKYITDCADKAALNYDQIEKPHTEL